MTETRTQRFPTRPPLNVKQVCVHRDAIRSCLRACQEETQTRVLIGVLKRHHPSPKVYSRDHALHALQSPPKPQATCETASVEGINARISSLVNPNGKRSHQQAAARPHSAKCSPRDVSERRCFSFSSTRQQLTPLSEGSGGASGHEEASVDSARGALPSPQRSAQDEDALTGGQESKAASPIATDTAKFAAPWIFEAKPGGWLHMREHKRIFALTSPATAAPTAKGDAHSEAAAAENSNLSSFSECSSSVEGIPMIQFRSAAIRGGQQRCGVGTLIQKQCIQAIAAFGSTVERSWVYRHLTYPEADRGGTQLGRIFKRAEMRSYLRFLAARLPCLELQTLLEAFLSTGLSDMDEQQMKELLTLLHLGERQAAGDVVVVTSSSAKNRKVEVGGAASHCTCDLRHCCMPEQRSSRNSKGDSDSNNKSSTGDDSRDCCCDGLTADFLLRLLKGGSIPPACVPPCLRSNSAFRRLLSFIDKNHPLLRFVPPPGGWLRSQ
ncbi:uncharacterized protein LOC113147639 [Cyclospora cayetanensis]|uniref:Uncharacterized protein LOC113147639 n=1 Tax=Cyclospora cayetanensis TaxID=88456 RepID=A0A6P6S357_9EIME|nr:uncharacterized protein LOC113147639 [Cyclospora cayetanensis]